MNLDDETLKWLKARVKDGKFENVSAGVRKSVKIARHVLEKATPEEYFKFAKDV